MKKVGSKFGHDDNFGSTVANVFASAYSIEKSYPRKLKNKTISWVQDQEYRSNSVRCNAASTGGDMQRSFPG